MDSSYSSPPQKNISDSGVQSPIKKNILSTSLVLSLIAHCLGIVTLHHHSIWLNNANSQPPPSQTPWLASMDKKEKSEVLKEAFTGGGLAEAVPSFSPRSEQASLSLKSMIPSASDHPIDNLSFSLPPIPSQSMMTLNNQWIDTFTIPSRESINLLTHLPKDLIVPSFVFPTSSFAATPSLSPEELHSLTLSSPDIKQEIVSLDIPHANPLISIPPMAEQPSHPPVLRPSILGTLPQLPTLDQLDTSSYSESFETDLVFLPKENGEGYIFALTLIPKDDLQLPKIRQNYVFLIDRANSIQKERLDYTKNAVAKVIEALTPDDTFNIVSFDSKMEKLSPSPLHSNNSSIEKAEDFLKRVELSNFFSPADLYKPLLLCVPSDVEDDEIYTAILLTDGESLGKKGLQRNILQQWTYYNEGKVALYIMGMENDRHRPLLETLTSFNRGKVISSNTKRGFKRKFLKLMKTIQTPVAKNLSVRAFSRSSGNQIELFPKSNQAPHLFQGQPYVILGSTNSLDDFILFIQGRLKNQWLNIKKKISFISAKKGSLSLKSEWALQQAYNLYEQFLLDNNSQHLVEAQQLLQPLQLEIPFQ